MNTTTHEQLMDVLREIPPLIPQFLRRRRVGVTAPSNIAAELGIERQVIFMLLQIDFVGGMYDQDRAATLQQLRSYDLYSTFDNIATEIGVLKELGLVLEDSEGMLTLSEAASDALTKLQIAGIEFVSNRKPLPGDVLSRLADDLEQARANEKTKEILLSRPGSHLKGYASGARYRQEPLSSVPMVRIEQAMLELWGARDEAHILAWQNADLEGPPFDVLSHIWSGVNTLSGLVEVLKYKQTADDIENSLSWLTERELAQQHGDDVTITPKGVLIREDVESETNRVFFEGWTFSLDEATWIRDTLKELIAKLEVPA